MKPTIRDVAKKAGVSVSTVSLVLNGGRFVSPAMYQRVQAAISELNYVPNPLGRALSLKRTYTLVYVIPTIANPFFTSIIQAVESTASSYGYSLIVRSLASVPTHADPYTFLNYLPVDGALVSFASPISISAQYMPFVQRSIPVVSVGGAHKENDLDCFITNDDLGMQALTEYLINLGHSRIGYIGRQNSFSTDARLEGIHHAMQARGRKLQPEYIQKISGYSATDIYNATKHLLALPERPTAIACYNDSFAVEVLRTCSDLGLRVPVDVTITGYDDTLGSFMSPPLTTMRVPVSDMGRMAIEQLIKRIENNTTATPSTKTFQPSLVIRASSSVPPKE